MSRFVDPEKKYRDQSQAAGVNINTPLIFNVNKMGEGASVGTRVGRQIKMLSFYFRLQWFSNVPVPGADPLVPGIPTTLRVMVILDRQANGTTLNPGDVLQDSTNPLISPLNLANNKSLRILCDQLHVLDGTWKRQAMVNKFFNFKVPIITRYNSVSPNHDGVQTNAIWVLFFSDVGVATSLAVNVNTRLRYVG